MTPIRYQPESLAKRRAIPLTLDLAAAPHPQWLRGLPMPCASPSCGCLHYAVGYA